MKIQSSIIKLKIDSKVNSINNNRIFVHFWIFDRCCYCLTIKTIFFYFDHFSRFSLEHVCLWWSISILIYPIPNTRYWYPLDYIYSDFCIHSRFDLTEIQKIRNMFYSNHLENDIIENIQLKKVCYVILI